MANSTLTTLGSLQSEVSGAKSLGGGALAMAVILILLFLWLFAVVLKYKKIVRELKADIEAIRADQGKVGDNRMAQAMKEIPNLTSPGEWTKPSGPFPYGRNDQATASQVQEAPATRATQPSARRSRHPRASSVYSQPGPARPHPPPMPSIPKTLAENPRSLTTKYVGEQRGESSRGVTRQVPVPDSEATTPWGIPPADPNQQQSFGADYTKEPRGKRHGEDYANGRGVGGSKNAHSRAGKQSRKLDRIENF